MQRQRGTRTRIPENSTSTGPNPSTGGTPSDSSDDGIPADDGGHQDSSDEQSRVDRSIDTGTGQDEATLDRRTEHPDAESSHFDHSPEEAKRWDEMKRLRKSKKHADKKITEQGQRNSELQQERDEFSQRLARIENAVAQQHISRSSGKGDPLDGPDHGNLFDDQGGDEDVDGNWQDEVDQVKRVVGSIFTDQHSLNETIKGLQLERAHEKKVSDLQKKLGVHKEAAEVLIDTFESGDLLDFAEALELSTLPAEARATARETRDRQRSSVSHPVTTSSPYRPVDEDGARKRVVGILNLPDGRQKQEAIESFVDDYPEDGYNLLREAISFNT